LRTANTTRGYEYQSSAAKPRCSREYVSFGEMAFRHTGGISHGMNSKPLLKPFHVDTLVSYIAV
jgi:hypothetical protein